MTHDVSEFHLAQFNIARLAAPIDHPASAEFVRALEPINLLAEVSPGFVWRLQGADGEPSSFMSIPGIDDSRMLVNYSIWESVEALSHFAYRSGHSAYFRRRKEWFESSPDVQFVCWWVPAGEIPSVEEAYARLLHLREHGRSERGWPINQPWDPPAP